MLSPEAPSIFVFSKGTFDSGFLLEFDCEGEELTSSIGSLPRDSLQNHAVLGVSLRHQLPVTGDLGL